MNRKNLSPSKRRSRSCSIHGSNSMPTNRFPDSREKRELRRRDARRLAEYVAENGGRLDYCGLPSVEYLDVEAWRPFIRSVTAFESDEASCDDMIVERDLRGFDFPVDINP